MSETSTSSTKQTRENPTTANAAAVKQDSRAASEALRQSGRTAAETARRVGEAGAEKLRRSTGAVAESHRQMAHEAAERFQEVSRTVAETAQGTAEDVRSLMALPTVADSGLQDLQHGLTGLIEGVVQTNLRATQEFFRLSNPAAFIELQQRFVRDYMNALMEGSAAFMRAVRQTADADPAAAGGASAPAFAGRREERAV
jgi:hypothetical protein